MHDGLRPGDWNPRLGFKQSIKNIEYLWTVYSELAYLTASRPTLVSNILRGKKFYAYQFDTRQLPCLIEINN